jgi:hypothetical protein
MFGQDLEQICLGNAGGFLRVLFRETVMASPGYAVGMERGELGSEHVLTNLAGWDACGGSLAFTI